MNILHLTETITAYAPARFVDLINRYTEHSAKLIQLKSFFLGNPLEIPLNNTYDETVEALEWADVTHFHGTNIFSRRRIVFPDRKQLVITKYYEKPYVLEFHGSPQRERYRRNQKGVPCLLVSTPEMVPLFHQSKAKFFPCLIDEKSDLYKQREEREDNKIKIGHHFSFHRRVKDTDRFLAVKEEIKENENFSLELINKGGLKETIEERAKYDAVFDHCQGYYGLVSIEAMAQGIAVINGCGKRTFDGINTDSMDALNNFFGSKPPFIYANRSTLKDVILSLSKETIEECAEKGKEYMANAWSGEKNIHRLIEVYEKL